MRRLIITLALFNLSGVCFADLVQNGGFETGNFNGWTLVDPSNNSFVDMTLPHSGKFSADLGAFPMDGTLSQNLATTAGTTYRLAYWLQNDGGSPNDFFVSWNGKTVPNSKIVNNVAGFNYTRYSFVVVATAAKTPLQFNFEQTAAYWHLDDVSVNLAPEPSSFPILLIVFVGSGCGQLIRHFRHKRSV